MRPNRLASLFGPGICVCLALLAALLAALAMPVSACAHSLGVDKAVLTEGPAGAYELAVQVPTSLAPLIEPPILPERCTQTGNPRGQIGRFEVRFRFDCRSPLTADDRLVLPWGREGVMLTVIWASGEHVTRLVMQQANTIEIELGSFHAGSGTWFGTARRFTVLGVEHILSGIDHLLFVFGLMLLVRSIGTLIKTITAFTIAHSLTLALATLGVVAVPPAPVEASIALSIVFLAVEIVHADQGRQNLTHRAPWLVAFGFGLLHGLGFAGALTEVGLPRAEIPLALLFFNLGVEAGQLVFVALILLLRRTIGSLIARPTGAWAQVPAYVIGTVAMFWLMTRTGAMLGYG